jgi:hypothetical protein
MDFKIAPVLDLTSFERDVSDKNKYQTEISIFHCGEVL